MKSRVLFIMHMPPPVHGAAMMGKYIHDSKYINESFDCFYLNLSASSNISEVGIISVKKIFFLIKIVYKIVKAIVIYKPQICYYTPTSDGWGIYKDAFIIRLMRMFKVKILLHFHNKGVKNFSKHKMARLAYRIMYRNVRIILLSEHVYNDVSDYVSTDQVYYLNNGIPLSVSDIEYEEIASKRNLQQGPVKILFLSNMISEKGIWTLLDACYILKEESIDFVCDYVGNWGDTTKDDFQKAINQRGLQNKVHLQGPKYGDDKKSFLSNAQIFVFPTYYHGENFPLVLLEAMEYGLPCISTQEGGIPSIIHQDKNGFIIPQKDANQLAQKIKDLIFNANKIKIMGENSRQYFLSHFTIDHFENNLKGIIIDYLKSKN